MDEIKYIPDAEYHSLDRASKSALWKLHESPLHYKVEYIDGKKAEPSEPMILGPYGHALLLDAEALNGYAVAPDCDRRTKEGKSIIAEFAATNAGKTIIARNMADLASAIIDALIAQQRDIYDMITMGGFREQAVLWHDIQSGLDCKAKPDWMSNNYKVMADLKIVRSSSRHSFTRDAAIRGYHVQAAYYMDAVHCVTGVRPEKFIFVCVESKEPYPVRIYQIDEVSLDRGRFLYRSLLTDLARRRMVDDWALPDAIQTLTMPQWELRGEQIEE